MNEQQLLEKAQQTVIPPFVSEYIEEAKYYEWGLDDAFDHISEEPGDSEISVWFYTLGNVDVFARAWLDGYTVSNEKKYLVKMIGITSGDDYLNYHIDNKRWYFDNNINGDTVRTYHTHKDLEESGFVDVFNSPLFEITEVKE